MKFSTNERVRCVVLRSHGKSYTEISNLVSISRSTVWRICKNFDRNLPFHKHKKGAGRPPLSTNLEQRIRRYVTMNPETSLRQIKTNLSLDICTKSISKILHRMKYSKFVKRVKPRLYRSHVRARLDFARRYRHFNDDQWMNVLFTDEVKFIIGSVTKEKVWRKKGQALNPGLFRVRKFKFQAPSMKFWGSFTGNGLGPLVSIGPNWNQFVYRDILARSLPQIRTIIRGPWFMLEDNDKVHYAPAAQNFKNVNSINSLQFPPLSPDLNPVSRKNIKLVREHLACLERETSPEKPHDIRGIGTVRTGGMEFD
jgi:hypothetical protein